MKETILGSGAIAARYPSGQVMKFDNGTLYTMPLDGDRFAVFVIENPDDECAPAFMLDPRAIVSVNNVVLYHPRKHRTYNPDFYKWWQDHPEWDTREA